MFYLTKLLNILNTLHRLLTKKIICFDHNYEQLVIIFKNKIKIYAICYNNVYLTNDHLRTKKNLERNFNDASTLKKNKTTNYNKIVSIELKNKKKIIRLLTKINQNNNNKN